MSNEHDHHLEEAGPKLPGVIVGLVVLALFCIAAAVLAA